MNRVMLKGLSDDIIKELQVDGEITVELKGSLMMLEKRPDYDSEEYMAMEDGPMDPEKMPKVWMLEIGFEDEDASITQSAKSVFEKMADQEEGADDS